MKTKVCSKCYKEKPLSQFYKETRAIDRVRSQCIDCDKIAKHDYYLKHREETKKRTSNYYKRNKLEYKKYNKEYRLKNLNKIKKQLESKKEYIKQQRHNKYLENITANPNFNKNHYTLNKDKYAIWNRKSHQKNKIKNNQRNNEYAKKKRKEDINFRILCASRIRIYDALNGRIKSDTTKNLIGCPIDYLRQHIESQFKDGMSWENYGRGWGNKGMKEWHIDHIYPLASFDLTKPLEQRIACHWSNLQPLWAKENLEKSAKIL